MILYIWKFWKKRNIIIVFFSVGIFFFSRKENENASHDPIFFSIRDKSR